MKASTPKMDEFSLTASQTLSRSLSCQNMKVEGARAFESHRRGQYEGRYGRKSLQKSRGEW